MSSLKGNIILNYINTLSGLIFPIVTFPYAARVLQPEGIGVVNFLNSIIGYIVLLTSLGIPLYAVREIAKCRDDIELRNRTTIEIVILSTLLSILGYIAVFLLGLYVPRIHEDVMLFYVLSLTILFTGIGVQWFYQGIEDFVFITIRGLIIRFLSAASLFIFVRDKNDLLIYGLVIVGSTVGGNIINFVHLRNYLNLKSVNWKKIAIGRHVRPAIRIFLLNIIISIYINLNTIILGFMTDDRAVGLFTAGTRITHMLAVIVTSLGTVMIPRCSYLIGEGRIEEFNSVIKKAYHFMTFTALPITFGIILLAQPITLCFCGDKYADAIPVVISTAPTILFIGITGIIGMQILYPYGKENLVIASTIVAAVFNIVLNIILIPYFAASGAAISTLISEFAILIALTRLGKDFIPFKFLDRQVSFYVLSSIVMSAFVLICMEIGNIWLQVILGSLVGAFVYLAILFIVKDTIIQESICLIVNKIKSHKLF